MKTIVNNSDPTSEPTVTFETGAVRSDVSDQRFDLMSPVAYERVAAVRVDTSRTALDLVMTYLAGRRDEDYLAISCRNLFGLMAQERGFPALPCRYDDMDAPNFLLGLWRVAETYAEGAKKYSDHNWRKGMPFSQTLNHVIKHIVQWAGGDESEDHLAHAAWGLMAVMEFEFTHPELDDLYFSPKNIAARFATEVVGPPAGGVPMEHNEIPVAKEIEYYADEVLSEEEIDRLVQYEDEWANRRVPDAIIDEYVNARFTDAATIDEWMNENLGLTPKTPTGLAPAAEEELGRQFRENPAGYLSRKIAVSEICATPVPLAQFELDALRDIFKLSGEITDDEIKRYVNEAFTFCNVGVAFI